MQTRLLSRLLCIQKYTYGCHSIYERQKSSCLSVLLMFGVLTFLYTMTKRPRLVFSKLNIMNFHHAGYDSSVAYYSHTSTYIQTYLFKTNRAMMTRTQHIYKYNEARICERFMCIYIEFLCGSIKMHTQLSFRVLRSENVVAFGVLS